MFQFVERDVCAQSCQEVTLFCRGQKEVLSSSALFCWQRPRLMEGKPFLAAAIFITSVHCSVFSHKDVFINQGAENKSHKEKRWGWGHGEAREEWRRRHKSVALEINENNQRNEQSFAGGESKTFFFLLPPPCFVQERSSFITSTVSALHFQQKIACRFSTLVSVHTTESVRNPPWSAAVKDKHSESQTGCLRRRRRGGGMLPRKAPSSKEKQEKLPFERSQPDRGPLSAGALCPRSFLSRCKLIGI